MELIVNALIENGVQVAVSLVVALIGVAGTWLSIQIGKVKKLQTVKLATDEAKDAAITTVLELQQTVVDDLKAASVDGKLTKEEMRDMRREMQMIFQDPYSSLNPRMSVYDTIAEMLKVHKMVPDSELPARVEQLLTMSGLSMDIADRFPGEFSGGQRQRIGIARALYKQADVLFFDEATSSLDSRTEEEVNRSIAELSDENKELTIIVIAHRDSSLDYCDRVITIGT